MHNGFESTGELLFGSSEGLGEYPSQKANGKFQNDFGPYLHLKVNVPGISLEYCTAFRDQKFINLDNTESSNSTEAIKVGCRIEFSFGSRWKITRIITSTKPQTPSTTNLIGRRV